MRAWYPMDSASGSTVNDIAGNNDGVRVGPVSTTGQVAAAYVYTFNPTNRSGNTSNAARLEIGRTTGGGNYFDGAIDEVELFNRALSASEITSLWNAGDAGKCKLI